MHKTLIHTLIVLLVSQFLTAQEFVAILEFEGSGMGKIEAKNITERFSYELSQTRKFNLIERQDLDQIIDEQKIQLSGCVADECAVEVGKLAGASFVIAGSVTKTFGLYGIAVRLIDVESGAIVTHILESDESDVQIFISQRVRNAALRMAAEAGSAQGPSHQGTAVVNSGEKGSVLFSLSKPGAAVFIDGVYTILANTQTVSLNLAKGDHEFKFTLAGQMDWIKKLYVLEGETLNYDVIFESGPGSGGVQVDNGIVMVRSIPTGAITYLDGVVLGPTPAQNTKVGVGKHIITVEKPMFHPYAEEITIAPDRIEQVQAHLKPRYGRLTIKSEPTGAMVKLNGKQKGVTPLVIPELLSGDYTITISKDLYHTSEEKYTITDGSENERLIVLNPAFGKLSVSATPKGAKVFLSGQFKGRTPIILDKVLSGSYRLKVTQDLYEPLEEEIIVEDGMTNKQFIVLYPRFGTLIVTGSPTSAKIRINGKLAGNLPMANLHVATGLAKVEIEARDYHTHEQYINIEINGIYPLNIDLIRHSGTIIATSDPPETMLHLDGREIGPTPQILKKINTGQHTLSFASPGFIEEERKFSLGVDERKEINVKLTTYEGSIQQDMKKIVLKRNLSIVGAGGFALAALALKKSSNDAYDDYEKATETAEVLKLFDEADFLNKMSGLSLGISAAASATAFYIQVDLSALKSKLLKH